MCFSSFSSASLFFVLCLPFFDRLVVLPLLPCAHVIVVFASRFSSFLSLFCSAAHKNAPKGVHEDP